MNSIFVVGNFLDKQLLKLLVLIWLPLSVGIIDPMYDLEFFGIPAQQTITTILVSFGLLYCINLRTARFLPKDVILWLIAVTCSILYGYYAPSQIMQLIGMILMVFWVVAILSVYDVDDFIDFLSSAFKFWFVASIIYAVLFVKYSFGYVNDIYSIDSFYGHKNSYGRFVFLAIIMNFYSAFLSRNRSNGPAVLYKFLGWTFAYWFFLYLSVSKSSIALSVIFILLAFVLLRFSSSAVSRNILVLIFGCAFFIMPLAIIVAGGVQLENTSSAEDCLGLLNLLCIPMTGRATIWESIINDVLKDDVAIFGYGFNYYFGVLAPSALYKIGLGDFMPNDPHNGYVDLWVSMGWLGLALFAILIFRSLDALKSVQKSNFVFFMSFLVIFFFANITESYLIKSTNFYTFFFWFYIVSSHGLGSLRENKANLDPL